VLLHHPHGPLTHLGGKLGLLLHGSILSDVGASTIPGAVQASPLRDNSCNQLSTGS